MYVVLGASGNTGHVVAQNLLAGQKKVRVVARNTARLQPLAAQGAEVVAADLTDASALTQAIQQADSAYVMIPPNYASTDPRSDQARISDAIAAAVKNAGVKNIVALSSIGADKPSEPDLYSACTTSSKNSTRSIVRTYLFCAPSISWKTRSHNSTSSA
jgi:uncharacterized protein YbjT (DUF2867 family)